MKKIVIVIIHLLASVHLMAAEVLSKRMPDIMLQSNQGTDVRFSELGDQVILLNFWASWCRPCLEEMPLLNELHNQYSEAGFSVWGVNVENTTDSGILNAVNAFVSDRKIIFPVLYDPKKVLVREIEQHIMGKQMGLPTTVFIDRSGNARYLHEGYIPGDERDYRQLIEQLMQE